MGAPIVSAAEKLRTLEAPLPANLQEWGDEVRRRGAILLDALPQIVAVVEAAEAVTFYGQEAYRYNEWHGSRIVLTLTALEEALS